MYIHKFSVNNYRSLKKVDIGDLTNAVVLYGENDSGKSNILSFLEVVFQEKYTDDVVEGPVRPDGEKTFTQKKSSGFWMGQITDFSNNFYLNNRKPITFSIQIKLERSEITKIKNFPKKFLETLPKNRSEDVLVIDGKIVSIGPDQAEMSLTRCEFNQNEFYSGKTKTPDFLPSPKYSKLSSAERTDVFNGVMRMLDNAFLRVPADRFLTVEQEEPRGKKIELSSKTLKNWLFQSSHDRDAEKIVREIINRFNSKPFNHGNVSIVRDGKNEIETFIEERNGLKLPIGRRGSGVQQILMILSYIIQANSPIVGIEEIEINLSPETQKRIVTDLLKLINSKSSVVRQIIFITHSPHIGKRNEAQRRAVWMEKGETKVKKPSEAHIKGFFSN